MALKPQARSRPWLRLHLLERFLGLTGLLAAAVGLFLACFVIKNVRSWPAWKLAVVEFATGQTVDRLQVLAMGLLLGGSMLALLALLVETIIMVRFAAGRRGAFGGNVALQVLLAAALLVGVNVFSFENYRRYDWTTGRLFTLGPETREQMRRLRGETTIVVYQRHRTSSQVGEKTDPKDLKYDLAAERKVVEKVRDVVEQFQDLGPRFQVQVLDVEDEDFDDKLKALKDQAKELGDAVEAAPESSIFFYARERNQGKVQRLSFSDFYQLDKTASKEANDNQGNLVLRYQGVEPFARKVLNIDEKRPRVGLLVVHELLSSEGPDELGMAGVRKALTAQGFDVVDIILKKWPETGGPEPVVATYDENKFDRLEAELSELDANVKNLEDGRKRLVEARDLWKKASLADLTKRYADQLGPDQRITEAMRQRQLQSIERDLTVLSFILDQTRSERNETAQEKEKFQKGQAYADAIAEQRRLTDLKAKLDRLLVDCDLLIVPRMTLRNVASGSYIINRLYRLDPAQVESLKDFIKSGKPVLACFGPANESPDDVRNPRLNQLIPPGPDALEELLGQLGFKFGKETVLFTNESKAFAERRAGLLGSSASIEVPAVEFDWPPGSDVPSSQVGKTEPREPNPLRQSLLVSAHSVGKDLDLHLRHPRPITYDDRGHPLPYDPYFMVTGPSGWNEEQPFPSGNRVPRFDPAKDRLGRFPIGVAVETTVPADWTRKDGAASSPPESGGQTGSTIRVAAIGHGGLFVGNTLSPGKEKLLVDTSNWLLRRDDLLPKAGEVWQYPRVSLAARDRYLWQWGPWLLLPAFFAYLGFVVLIVRRVR